MLSIKLAISGESYLGFSAIEILLGSLRLAERVLKWLEGKQHLGGEKPFETMWWDHKE